MARISTKEELRRNIAEPRPAARVKLLDALDDQSIEFLKRCPFALVGTTSADGTIEVSPKGDEPGFIRVEDAKTLLIPERVGNNLAFGLNNIIDTGEIGIIAPVTEAFCGHCNRLRLTADGKIRTCLFSLHEHDLKPLLRGDANDTELTARLREIVLGKEDRHHIGEPGFQQPERTMSCIGG